MTFITLSEWEKSRFMVCHLGNYSHLINCSCENKLIRAEVNHGICLASWIHGDNFIVCMLHISFRVNLSYQHVNIIWINGLPLIEHSPNHLSAFNLQQIMSLEDSSWCKWRCIKEAGWSHLGEKCIYKQRYGPKTLYKEQHWGRTLK